jgi:predicted Zn-dependent peptidase
MGSLQVIATAKPGVPAERLESEILLHLDRIADKGPAEEDVERAKNRILLSYFAELQTVGRKADLLSMFTTYFDSPERLSEEPQTYDELGTTDLQEIARRWLCPEQRARVRVVPKDGSS